MFKRTLARFVALSIIVGAVSFIGAGCSNKEADTTAAPPPPANANAAAPVPNKKSFGVRGKNTMAGPGTGTQAKLAGG